MRLEVVATDALLAGMACWGIHSLLVFSMPLNYTDSAESCHFVDQLLVMTSSQAS